MGNVSINVYAINGSANVPFKVEGIDLATIKKVMSTWDSYGNWVGSNKPSNYQSINSQLVVAKDAISNDTDNYYDNRTLEVLIPELSGYPAPAYKVYTALLTQSGGNGPSSLNDEPLTIGVTYLIHDLGGSGWDFTNVGAPNNNIGTYFVATGTTANSWGDLGVSLDFNTGAPVVTVLENTIGNVWFTYGAVGQYSINFSETLSYDNVYCQGYSISEDGGIFKVTSLFFNNPNQIGISATLPVQETNSDDLLSNTPIEIRVYN